MRSRLAAMAASILAHAIGAIRARLRGDDAYSPKELARLNARRTSTAPFVPYDDPPRPAP